MSNSNKITGVFFKCFDCVSESVKGAVAGDRWFDPFSLATFQARLYKLHKSTMVVWQTKNLAGAVGTLIRGNLAPGRERPDGHRQYYSQKLNQAANEGICMSSTRARFK